MEIGYRCIRYIFLQFSPPCGFNNGNQRPDYIPWKFASTKNINSGSITRRIFPLIFPAGQKTTMVPTCTCSSIMTPVNAHPTICRPWFQHCWWAWQPACVGWWRYLSDQDHPRGPCWRGRNALCWGPYHSGKLYRVHVHPEKFHSETVWWALCCQEPIASGHLTPGTGSATCKAEYDTKRTRI